MNTSTVASIFVIVLVILGGWYWQSMKVNEENVQQSTGEAGINGSQNQTNTGLPSVAPVVTLASDKTLGSYLVSSNSMTLYTYAKDTASVSNCSGTCAVNWPPYIPLANEPLVAGSGVVGQLAAITRADGTAQLTYKGMPLYFWKNDTKPGDTTGQNVGGVWFVVHP